jgi:hypothetical protein
MKTKTITFKTLLIVFIVIYACAANIVKGQSTCATATGFIPSSTYTTFEYNIIDSIYWIKFVATDTSIFLKLTTPTNNPKANITKINLYSGTCANLILLMSVSTPDSLKIAKGNLSIGSTYFIKFRRYEVTSAYFSIGTQYLVSSSTQLTCDPPSCDVISNGLFETIDWLNFYQDSPFAPGKDKVCGWKRAWGTPNISNLLSVPNNHYALLWSATSNMGKLGEAILSNGINLPAGNYLLNYSYRIGAPNNTNTLDSIIVALTNYTGWTPCAYTGTGDIIPYTSWTSNTRQIISTVVSAPVTPGTGWVHVSVPFTTNIAYSSLVIYPSSTNLTSWLSIDSVSINGFAEKPIISGQWNTCHVINDTVVTSDTILNWSANNTYHYYVGYNGIHHLITTNPFIANWTGHEDGGWLYVEVEDNTTHCIAVDSFKVFGCCINGEKKFLADTTITTPSTFSSAIAINGKLIIDANVIIGGGNLAIVHMGPNAQIIIKPSRTLTINSSSIVSAACDTMWDGIYIAGPTAHLVVQNSVTIRDAKNAIVSNSGGDFQLSDVVTMEDNYRNIVVNEYTGATHTGKISQTSIKCTPPLLTQYPPVSASRTYSGVEVFNVDKIFIGDTSSYSKRNTFDNMDYGINARCSHIYVYNNRFLGISATPPTSTIGSAVYALGGRNCGDYVVVGGQNASGYYRSNYFYNCFNGIYYSSSIGNYIKAEYDTLFMQTTANTLPTGIYAYAAGTSTGTIRYNKITNGNYGIKCVDFGAGVSLNISSNYIENAVTGIAVTNAISTAPYTFQIAKNKIKYLASYTYAPTNTGILVTNVAYDHHGGATPEAYLSLNSVVFTTPNLGVTSYGIRVQNCPYTKIEQCSVTNSSNAPNSIAQAIVFNGIQVELSTYAYLCKDTAIKMGCGLRFVGSMTGSKATVNNMTSTYYGVRLDNAVIGDQGTAALANGNVWNTNTAYKVQGSIAGAALNWYYTGAYSAANTLCPFPFSVAGTFNTPTSTTSATTCAVITPQLLMSTLEPIVNNTSLYSMNTAENTYLDQKMAYSVLDNDASLRQSMISALPATALFYTSKRNGNIGKLEQVNDLMASEDYATAETLNNSISPENALEADRKTVNSVYLQTWAKGIFNFTNDEYQTLRTIADKSPILFGDAVYSAMVMVGEVAASSASNRMADTTKQQQTTAYFGKAYPNPANNAINLNYKIEEGQKATLAIYNLVGQLIEKHELNSELTSIAVNTSNFIQGIYIFKIMLNSEIISNDKVVIIK